MKVILAVDKNWAIGKGGQMIYDLSSDLAHFKETTMGSTLIMGKKTYDSIGRPLPGRNNIVLSRDKDLIIDGCLVLNSLEEALDYISGLDEEVYLIGGAKLIDQAIGYVDGAIITKIDAESKADVFAHNFDKDPDFRIVEESNTMTENGLDFKYVSYERIKNEG